jgi:hypothetical protein
LSEIDTHALLHEHAHGDSFRTIAERRGISHETARQVVIAQEKAVLGGIAYDLYAAHKAEQQGKTGEWPTFLIPNQIQSDRMLALDFFAWVVNKLKGLMIPLEVKTRPTPEGTAFMLLLDDQELDRREAATKETPS